MQTNKYFAKFGVLIALFCFFMSAQAAPQNDPIQLLKYIAENMVRELKVNKATLKSKPSIVYSLANRYVVPYADVPKMAQRVVPANIWNGATPAERAEFQQQFTRILIRTYASALTAYNDQVVKFYPIRGNYQNANTVIVRSVIESSESSPVQVTYSLLHQGGTWRLFDMSVEGVSMLESFRAQFSDILQQGNMATLLKRLSSHNSTRAS